MGNKTMWYFAGAIIVVLLAIAGLSGAFKNFLAFAPIAIPIPATVYSGPAYLSTANITNSAGQPSGSGLIYSTTGYSTDSGALLYSITYANYFYNGNDNQFNTEGPYNLYIAQNASSASFASASDVSSLPGINSSINSDQSTLNSYESAGECNQADGYNPGTCNSYQAHISALEELRTIFLDAVKYNNNIPQLTTTTTIVPIVGVPTNTLSTYWTTLVNFLQSVYKFLITPYSLSIAVNPANFTVSQPFTTQVSLPIPAAWQTKNTTLTNGKFVQQTYCAYFVTNNQSVNLIQPQPTPVLVQGAYYNTSFQYIPTSPQILVVGGLCRSDNITYSSITGTWSSWSSWVTVANQSAIAKQGITSITPNPITSFFSGIITWFENLFKGL